jgi:hypothetical protein
LLPEGYTFEKDIKQNDSKEEWKVLRAINSGFNATVYEVRNMGTR